MLWTYTEAEMGKYRDHRERRGKRHGSEQGSFSEPVYEPSYFQDAPSVTPDTVDAEVVWFNAGKAFGFVKLSDGAEAYLHIRVLEAAGGYDLSDGTQLTVTVEKGPRGPQIAKVIDIGAQIPITPVVWHLIVRMCRLISDLAFNCENLGLRILKLSASAMTFSSHELRLSCSRRRQ
ncbi:cold-shock protein [Mesorhizobium sp. 2RAF21]|uniref:cold-shock protein n=1 Tax=Mesorhizobium sp. 2RAF21 TaxID=3232995 RepID=UPI003F95F8D1